MKAFSEGCGGTRFHLLAVLFLAACTSGSGDAASDSSIRVDTVNGVPRVTVPGEGVWRSGEEWTIGEPLVRLGGPDAPFESSWGSVSAAVISAEGRLHVADARSQEIRVFDLDGGYAGSFGRAGEGPGEFSLIDALAISPTGILAVRDPVARRVTLLGTDGSFIRSYPMKRGAQVHLDPRPNLWIDRDRRVFDPFTVQRGDDPDRGSRTLGFVVYDSLGAVVDSLETVTWQETNPVLSDDEGRRVVFTMPFSPSGAAAITAEGTAVAGVSDAYMLSFFEPRGGLQRIVRVDVAQSPLTSADRAGAEGALEEQLATARDLIGFGGRQVPDVDLPSSRPFFGDLFVDPGGNVWVGEYALSGHHPERFDILDPEGRLLGTLEVPPMEIAYVGSEWIVGVETDESDVQYVLVLPIIRP